MKKLKTKILTAMLGAALGAAAFGGAMLSTKGNADTQLSAPSKIFYSYSSASVAPDTTDLTQTAFSFPDGGRIALRRDLALKWYAGTDASYLHFTFQLKDLQFETLTFTFESDEAIASKEGKSKNIVVFTSDGTSVTVKVNDQAAVPVVDPTADVTFSLSQDVDAKEGEYNVNLNGEKVGTFDNVGGYYADYSSTRLSPLQIQAALPTDAEEGATTVLLFKDLNGQSFTLNEEGAIAEDTAAPVLVLEEEISQFTIGNALTFKYQTVDVLDESVGKTVKYYQWDPNAAVSYTDLPTKGAIISETKWGDTTVLKEKGCEYFSVTVRLTDDSHTGDDAATYHLAWYVEDTETIGSVEYIRATVSNSSPIVNADYLLADYQALIEEKAALVNAGESSYLYLPSLLGMFEDEQTSQKALRYNVYYKNYKSETSSVEEKLTLSNLKVPVKNEGDYEIRIVAINAAGNVMKGTNQDGEVVEITASNVWDIQDVPTFSFTIAGSDMSMSDEKLTLRSSTGTIGVKQTVEAFKVEGPAGYTSQYALYFFDWTLFHDRFEEIAGDVDETVLVKVEADLRVVNLQADDDILEKYAEAYAKALADIVEGIDADDLLEVIDGKAILRRIEESKSSVSSDVFPDNKYAWNPAARTFNPAEEGIYLVIGVFSHPEQMGKTVGGYHVITVSATEDIIKGETQWLQNNMTSVILFGIAGILLIVVLILLLVKPSEEKLEDITEVKGNKKE